jgi:hypothetical protein
VFPVRYGLDLYYILFRRNSVFKELTIINDGIIHRLERNLASTYRGICGDNWTSEDAEIGFPPPGGTGRQVVPYSPYAMAFIIPMLK